MIKFKEGGIVHQLYTMFGIQNTIYGAKSVCQIFWGIILNLAVLSVAGGTLAFFGGHLVGGIIASIVTLTITLPVAVALLTLTVITVVMGGVWGVFTVVESEKMEELNSLVKEAYVAHKQKYCPNVEFTS